MRIYTSICGTKKRGDEGNRIDGPACWDVPSGDQSVWGLGINQSFDELARKMTKNDFLYLFFIGHGLMNPDGKGEGAFTIVQFKATDNYIVSYNLLKPRYGDLYLNQKLSKLPYPRTVMVFDCCGAGAAIDGTDYQGNDYESNENLKGEYRTIITACGKNEEIYPWNVEREWEGQYGTPPTTAWDHSEFLWNNENNGFIYALKNSGPISMRTAFNSGYTAAKDQDYNEKTSTAKVYSWIPDREYYTYL